MRMTVPGAVVAVRGATRAPARPGGGLGVSPIATGGSSRAGGLPLPLLPLFRPCLLLPVLLFFLLPVGALLAHVVPLGGCRRRSSRVSTDVGVWAGQSRDQHTRRSLGAHSTSAQAFVRTGSGRPLAVAITATLPSDRF